MNKVKELNQRDRAAAIGMAYAYVESRNYDDDWAMKMLADSYMDMAHEAAANEDLLRHVRFPLWHSAVRDHAYTAWCDGCNRADKILLMLPKTEGNHG